MDPKLPGLVGFTSNYWSSKGSTCYYWASLCRMWSHCGLSWRASALLRQLQGCGKRDTDNIHLRSHPLTSDFSFPLIHSLKIGHLLRKIFDTSAFTSRSPRMKSVWESVLSLQHGSVFCFVLLSRAACFLVRSIPSCQGGNRQMLASTRLIAVSV